jgi:hypothetical protein
LKRLRQFPVSALLTCDLSQENSLIPDPKFFHPTFQNQSLATSNPNQIFAISFMTTTYHTHIFLATQAFSKFFKFGRYTTGARDRHRTDT